MTRDHPIDEALARQAADWFLLMHAEQLPTEAQLQAFLDWLQDPAAEAAYARCEDVWALSGGLGEQASAAGARLGGGGVFQRWRRWQGALRYGLQAACLALVAIAALWGGSLLVEDSNQVYQTATGQWREVTLPDGTLVTLNTSSEIHVQYRRGARKVFLESGEALFDVIRDSHRPFSVVAGSGEITALGTIFTVKKNTRRNTVDVALLEGRIEVEAKIVDPDSRTRRHRVRLSPRDSLRYGDSSISAVQKVDDLNRLTEWRDGRLSFTNAALVDIIEEVNRYTVNKLIVNDRELLDEKIDAYFVIGDTDTLLSALKETLGVRWSYRPDGILVYRDPNPGPR